MIVGRRQASPLMAALLTLPLAATAAAQTAQTTPAGTASRPPGWSLAPAIGVSQMWDDNPTLAAEGETRPGDFVTALRPSLAIGYRGPRTLFRTDYAGSFDFYNELEEQNTRDHRAGIDFGHRVTRHVQIFARDQAMISPTTGDAALLGPEALRRQTTRMNAFRGGFDAALGPKTTLTGAYVTQWIDFADDGEPVTVPSPALLQGGHSHGASGELRRRLSTRFTLGADYDAQRAIVAGGTETFDVQSALGVVEFALSPSVSASGAYGHAWLFAGQNGVRRNAPAFNVGLDWQHRRFGGSLRYSRAFLPSFGFGGTFQNAELRATLRAALSRYVEWNGDVGLTDAEPLEPGDPTLRAVTAQTGLGWTIKRRLRLDVFGLHVFQDSGLAGGRVFRTRAGVQATVIGLVRTR